MSNFRLLRLVFQSCVIVLAICVVTAFQSSGEAADLERNTVRIAAYNTSLNRPTTGQLTQDLTANDEQAAKVASVLRRIRPDIVLLSEVDYDANGSALKLFVNDYLQAPESRQLKSAPISYPHSFSAPVNTGVPSGIDLNKNGRNTDAADGFGFGNFPGQYGMVVLSRFPIQRDAVRTFRELLWSKMPGAAAPVDPATGQAWYQPDVWSQLRLSSKSHWDVPVMIGEHIVHLLACHPTPPAFDGPEDRNGHRNHDEIRFWSDYLSSDSSSWIVDDNGQKGGLSTGASFVILGDLNADPVDGASYNHAIHQLLRHPRVNAAVVPRSQGAIEAAQIQGQANGRHSGPPACDTGDFSDRSVGNLRIDYALPSLTLPVDGAGVEWPISSEPNHTESQASDHHLVWIDITVHGSANPD